MLTSSAIWKPKHHQITKKPRERRRGDTPLIRSVSTSDGITSTWTTSSPLSRCRSEEKGIKTFKEISVRLLWRRRQPHKDRRCGFSYCTCCSTFTGKKNIEKLKRRRRRWKSFGLAGKVAGTRPRGQTASCFKSVKLV